MNKCKIEKLIEETVTDIYIPHKMEQKLIQACMKRKHVKNKVFFYPKLAAAILSIVILGTSGLGVYATVNYVKQRMENMPEQEIEQFETINNSASEINADTYSREYSPEETKRSGELSVQYHKGTFPQGSIKQVQTDDGSITDELYYVIETSTFMLPDRELTDEELLQLIDFIYKRDYSLTLDEEVKQVKEQQQKENEQKREEIAKAGGISEEEAIQIAALMMKDVFKIDISGMELNHYPVANKEMWELDSGYSVTYSRLGGNGNNDFYYFGIDAANGEVVSVAHSGGFAVSDEAMLEKEVKEQLLEMNESAKKWLADIMEIDVTEYNTYYQYPVSENGNMLGSGVTFIYEKNKEDAYIVSWCINKTANQFSRFEKTNWQAFERNKEANELFIKADSKDGEKKSLVFEKMN